MYTTLDCQIKSIFIVNAVQHLTFSIHFTFAIIKVTDKFFIKHLISLPCQNQTFFISLFTNCKPYQIRTKDNFAKLVQ